MQKQNLNPDQAILELGLLLNFNLQLALRNPSSSVFSWTVSPKQISSLQFVPFFQAFDLTFLS